MWKNLCVYLCRIREFYWILSKVIYIDAADEEQATHTKIESKRNREKKHCYGIELEMESHNTIKSAYDLIPMQWVLFFPLS